MIEPNALTIGTLIVITFFLVSLYFSNLRSLDAMMAAQTTGPETNAPDPEAGGCPFSAAERAKPPPGCPFSAAQRVKPPPGCPFHVATPPSSCPFQSD